jgi:hypothetical protein
MMRNLYCSAHLSCKIPESVAKCARVLRTSLFFLLQTAARDLQLPATTACKGERERGSICADGLTSWRCGYMIAEQRMKKTSNRLIPRPGPLVVRRESASGPVTSCCSLAKELQEVGRSNRTIRDRRRIAHRFSIANVCDFPR